MLHHLTAIKLGIRFGSIGLDLRCNNVTGEFSFMLLAGSDQISEENLFSNMKLGLRRVQTHIAHT